MTLLCGVNCSTEKQKTVEVSLGTFQRPTSPLSAEKAAMSTPEQLEEINMSEIPKDEEPPESNVKQSEEDDLLELEIQRHGIIQANWKHWQQITMIKPNLKTHISSKKSFAKFIIKLVLVGFR